MHQKCVHLFWFRTGLASSFISSYYSLSGNLSQSGKKIASCLLQARDICSCLIVLAVLGGLRDGCVFILE